MLKDKEMNERLTQLLSVTWEDEHMLDYCLKKIDEVIVLKDNSLITIDKPRIKTHFCFGHGLNGVSTREQEESANNLMRYAETNSQYFIRENLEGINQTIKSLQKALEEYDERSGLRIYTRQHYTHGDSDLRSINVTSWEHYPENAPYFWGSETPRRLDKEDIQRCINGYENVKARFIKRLNTYLKRYGLTKLRTWTYLVD